MKFYIKGDSVGVVMTKTELAVLYAAHGEISYETIMQRLDEDKSIIGDYSTWKNSSVDGALHDELRRFLQNNR